MKFRIVKIIASLFVVTQVIYPQVTNNLVQTVLDDISLTNLIKTVSILSGEEPASIGDEEITIFSRYMNHPHNDAAADYLKQELLSFGLEVEDQYYASGRNTLDGVGRNIIGKKLGVEYPEKKLILCAHYDSITSSGADAPGADDNASGTAAVIEAARILSNYQTKYTMLFVLFDEEELGMIGSKYYADMAWSSGDEILGVINMDMIAFDSNNDWSCDLHVRDIANSLDLKDKMLEVNSNYSLMLNIDVHLLGDFASDQAPFWNRNYGGLLLIEDYRGNLLVMYNDFNAFYHTANDRLFAFNGSYYKALSKLGIGTFTELVEIVIPSGSENEVSINNQYALMQNYPNPFNPSTVITFNLPESGNVKLSLFDVLGNELEVMLNESMQAGTHDYRFSANNLSSGVYFYQLQFEGQNYQRKMIIAK